MDPPPPPSPRLTVNKVSSNDRSTGVQESPLYAVLESPSPGLSSPVYASLEGPDPMYGICNNASVRGNRVSHDTNDDYEDGRQFNTKDLRDIDKKKAIENASKRRAESINSSSVYGALYNPSQYQKLNASDLSRRRSNSERVRQDNRKPKNSSAQAPTFQAADCGHYQPLIKSPPSIYQGLTKPYGKRN